MHVGSSVKSGLWLILHNFLKCITTIIFGRELHDIDDIDDIIILYDNIFTYA